MSRAAATLKKTVERSKIKRYHFNIAGQEGKLGLAGAVFANDDEEALLTLQETLADLEGRGIIDNYGGSEPQNFELGLSYVCLCTNGMKATLDMFDEIEDAYRPGPFANVACGEGKTTRLRLDERHLIDQ